MSDQKLQFVSLDLADGFLFVGNPKDFAPRHEGVIEEWVGDLAEVTTKDGIAIAGLVSFGPDTSVVVDAVIDEDGVVTKIVITPTLSSKPVESGQEEPEYLTLPGGGNAN
jgi:hypothetical protein